MNSIDYKEMFDKMPDSVDKENAIDLIQKCIDKQGIDLTIVRCMEEYAELIQELSKSLRNNCDRDRLLEELADATLCTTFIQLALNIDEKDLNKAINTKLKHAENRL